MSVAEQRASLAHGFLREITSDGVYIFNGFDVVLGSRRKDIKA